jgi:alpha-L-arabinofuranosidase
VDKIAQINPHIYGHFTEHLGRCFYDGLWVDEDSLIPNIDGFRVDIIEALRKIKPVIIRWPGGCFADDYHWQDGIGPRSQRPRRINIHWGEVIETNQVGTQEFIRLCRLVGAEPYLCGNLGSGTARELRDWVEYCNFPDASSSGSTSAQKRAADNHPEPFNVAYWEVGNENWGCGGNFSPEDHGTEGRIPFVAGSASLKDHNLFLTMTNNHSKEPCEVNLDLSGGASVTQATGKVLSGKIHAHNTFDEPEIVKPKPLTIEIRNGRVSMTLPAACVAAVNLVIG